MSGPRGGRPGCGWRRCRWPGTPIRDGSRKSSPAASGRWRSTWLPRCWTGIAARSRRLLLRTSVLELVSGPLADCPDRRFGRRADLAGAGGDERVRCIRWMRRGPGSATTTCSPTCSSWSCGAPHRERSPRCTRRPPAGPPGTGTRWRRSATPRPQGTGVWPHACSPTTGRACSWAGRPPPYTSSSPGSPPRPPRYMPSSPCSSRPTSWLRDRSKRQSSIWGWRRGRRQRCQSTGMSSYRSCSRWPGCS